MEVMMTMGLYKGREQESDLQMRMIKGKIIQLDYS